MNTNMNESQKVIDQLTRELEQTKRRFSDLFDNMGGALWSYEIATDRFDLSSGYEQVYGYTREAFERDAKLWREVIHPDDRSQWYEQMNSLASGIPGEFEHRIITPDGKIRWVHCTCNPVMDKLNQVVKVNGLAINITEKKAPQQRS